MTERTITGEEFREVIGHFATGVSVITAIDDGRPLGTTASAIASLSLEPPMVVACLNRSSQTGGAIDRAGRFAINILAEHQGDLARQLATKDAGKFELVEFEHGEHGQPLLAEALAHIECTVEERAEGGTHIIFIARVDAAQASDGEPLAYFRGRFGRIQIG